MDLDNTPVMPAPPGQISDLDPSMTGVQRGSIILSSGMLSGAAIALMLRMWARAFIIRRVNMDDYMIVVAWLAAVAFFVCSIAWMEKAGLGNHLWDISLSKFQKYGTWTIPILTLYCWSLLFSKFSILLTYHHVNPSRKFRIMVYIVMVTVLGYSIASTVIVCAGCRPTDPDNTSCIETLGLVQAVANIATDLVIVIMPIPMIHRLQLPLGQRIGVGIVVAGGSFVIVASIIRITWVKKLPDMVDYSWEGVRVVNWSTIEINVAIMCQCIVALKPLLKHYAPKLLGYSGNGRSIWSKFFSSRGLSRLGRSWGNSLPLASVDRGEAAAATKTGTIGGDESTRSVSAEPEARGRNVVVVTSTFEVNTTYEPRDDGAESTEDIVGRAPSKGMETKHSYPNEQIVWRQTS